jgi:hypothetical protein
MDDTTDLALRALAAATSPADTDAAAAICERAADEQQHAPYSAQDRREAAALLRRLSATIERPPRGLRFSYGGPPVRLDASLVDEDSFSPIDKLEPEAGHASATLFNAALAAGAVIAPAGITVECVGDDDTIGGGVVLIANQDGHTQGVTCGHRDVANIDGLTPVKALEYMVDELNAALGAQPDRGPACHQVLELRTGEELVALRADAPAGAPAHAANCDDEIGWRCTNVHCTQYACYLDPQAEPSGPTRVAIAARNPFTRDALADIVAADQRRVVVATTTAYADDVATLVSVPVDVLVIEVAAGGRDYTLAELDSISQALPEVRLVVFPGPGAPKLENLRPHATGALIEAPHPDARQIRLAITRAADRA